MILIIEGGVLIKATHVRGGDTEVRGGGRRRVRADTEGRAATEYLLTFVPQYASEDLLNRRRRLVATSFQISADVLLRRLRRRRIEGI